VKKITSNQNWHWSAFGKHPAAKDYFRSGENHPLIKGFSDWVEIGYQTWTSKRFTSPGPCAWRFWARGARRENVVCGLIRDSSDSLGRPYPLLIIGTGPLKDWEKYWNLLPFACEGAWSQMESLSIRMFSGLEPLVEDLERIHPPQAHWSDYRDLDKSNLSQNIQASQEKIKTMAKENEILASLDEEGMKDSLTSIYLYHSLLKTHLPEMVTTAFMGGSSSKTWLAFFRRPLVSEDFVRLWSVD
jgi:type VI secretion system protein VasJ